MAKNTTAKATGQGGKTVDFTARLKKANAAWAGAKEKAAQASDGPVEFEDGKYLARLTAGELGESQNGRLQVKFIYKFEESETHHYGGKEKWDFQGVESEQNLEYLGRLLARLGYELPEDLTEILDILKDIGKEKPLCQIRLKSKGDYQNVYLDKVFGNEVEDDDDAEDDAADSEAEETEEEEVAPAKPAKGKGKAKAAPVEEEEEEESDDEEESDEDDEEEEADEDEGEAEDDSVDLAVGMKVSATTSTGERSGVVVEILDSEGIVRVKMDDNGKIAKVAFDKLAMIDDVPEEPAPAPKGKKTKK